MKLYDLIIIGSGPAGVSVAKMVLSRGLSVLLIERGKDIGRHRDLISGWFGRGLYAAETNLVLDNLDSELSGIIGSADLNCAGRRLAEFYFDYISRSADIAFDTSALSILKKGDIFVVNTSRREFKSRRCVISTGRNSLEWVKEICTNLDVTPNTMNKLEVGVRIELPTFRTDKSHIDNIESIGTLLVSDIRCNSFIGEWEDSGIVSAFGYNLPNKCSKKTSFILGKNFYGDEIEKALREVKIANILQNDKIRPERIVDHRYGKSVLRHLDTFRGLEESINYLEELLPMLDNYATIYIPEVRLSGVFPTNYGANIKGLYGAGECTNKANSIVGAISSGIEIAKNILMEMDKDE